VDGSPRLMKIQYYPDKLIKDRLETLHKNVTIPILKYFGNGYTLWINSGYRCKEYNNTLPEASPTSDHIKGFAADFELTKNGKSANKELFDFIRQNLKFKQLIDEKKYSWIHASYDLDDLKKEVLHL
jgi:hypothetical protein